jgi:hypothetical protein
MGGAGCRCESCPAADLAASRTTHHHRHCLTPAHKPHTTPLCSFWVPVNVEMMGLVQAPQACPSQRDKPCTATSFKWVPGQGVRGVRLHVLRGCGCPPPLSHLLCCPPPTRCRCCCRAAHPHPSGAPFICLQALRGGGCVHKLAAGAGAGAGLLLLRLRRQWRWWQRHTQGTLGAAAG